MKQHSHLQQSIIYVNFAPYENAGKIFDYILNRFRTVLVFSFNFHHLGINQESSALRIYRNGKLINRYRLFQTPTSAQFAFLLLPIRSLIIFLQLLFHTIRLRTTYGPYDLYFTVNAFTAWSGNLLRDIGIVRKTIFWVWDYYPPVHKSKITVFMRWMYWLFDKPASLQADKTVFLNKRLEDLRKTIGILPQTARYPIVPIGTNPVKHVPRKYKSLSLVFLGVLKKSQGLDLLFDACGQIERKFPNLTIHIIGGGPDATYFIDRSKQTHLKTIFYGYVPSDRRVNQIISKCHIGLATYVPEESNVSYYSDPSKIKKYISFGLPVITTDVFYFAKEIQKYKAGIVVNYFTHGSIIPALDKITKHYGIYRDGAIKLAKKYQYQKLYGKLFYMK